MPVHPLSLLVSNTILHQLDEDRRPLGEHASTQLYQQAGVHEITCPYPDNRQHTGKPINAAALKQTGSCWRHLIHHLQYIAYQHRTANEPYLSTHMMWRTHLIAHATPALFLLSSPPNTPVPRQLSALFKTSLGYATILPSLLISQPGCAQEHICNMLPEKDFFDLCNQQLWLIGQSQVCAGSATHIQSSYMAMGKLTHDIDASTIHPTLTHLDIPTLSHTLAEVWALLLQSAIATRDLIRQGHAEALLDFNLPSPPPESRHTWPICMQIFTQPHAPRHFALPRSLPALQQDHVVHLFEDPLAYNFRPLDSFEEIDQQGIKKAIEMLSMALPPTHNTWENNYTLSECFDLRTTRQ